MRHWSIGIVLPLTVAYIALGPTRASDPEPAGGATAPSQPGRVLELQVISSQAKEPLAGVDLEIRLGSQTRKDVTNEQGRCRTEYGPQPPDYLSIRASKQALVPMRIAWRSGGDDSDRPGGRARPRPEADCRA